MLVKFNKDYVYDQGDGEFVLSTFLLTERAEDKLEEGKLTLSFKVGKKRKLVTGKLRCETQEHFDYTGGYTGYSTRFFFTPNNLEKFNKLTQ